MNFGKKTQQYISAALVALLLSTTSTATVFASEKNTNSFVKNENVYAKLSADGSLGGIYIVNAFDVKTPTTIKDFGTYTKIDNLSSPDNLNIENNIVEFEASEGKFYFQGTADTKLSLPWNISIEYTLNGKPISSKELAGQSGDLEINIKTSNNPASQKVFYDNYLMQISLALDSDNCTEINAKGASIAEAGTNQNIVFTSMPGTDGNFTIKSKVKNFEMSGISIAAVPYNMSIDMDDLGIDEMTSELTTLADAIQLLNHGTQQLRDGMSELSNGGTSLKDGITQLNSGLTQLNSNSETLTTASTQIGTALSFINTELSKADLSSMSEVSKLPDALDMLSKALVEVQSGLSQLHEGFNTAYGTLNASISSSQNELTQEEMTALQEAMASANDNPTATSMYQKLLKSYSDIKTIEGTFNAVKPAFEAVLFSLNPSPSPGLEGTSVVYGIGQISGGLKEMQQQLQTALAGNNIEDAISMLQDGLNELSNSYGDFHEGLKGYTDGVSVLVTGSNELTNGLGGYVSGVKQAESGTNDLADGVKELADGTKEIPTTIQSSIDDLMSQYNGGNFEPVSFVDERNTSIGSVQFVISTEGITIEEPEPVIKTESKESFWTKLLNLFKQ